MLEEKRIVNSIKFVSIILSKIHLKFFVVFDVVLLFWFFLASNKTLIPYWDLLNLTLKRKCNKSAI